jgi:hypothetical protein
LFRQALKCGLSILVGVSVFAFTEVLPIEIESWSSQSTSSPINQQSIKSNQKQSRGSKARGVAVAINAPHAPKAKTNSQQQQKALVHESLDHSNALHLYLINSAYNTASSYEKSLTLH